MKRGGLAVILIVVVFGALMERAAAMEERPEGEFVLRAARREYHLDLGQPVEVRGLRGATLEVVLRRAAKVFNGYGVRFSYPGGLTVETDEREGAVQIVIRQEREYFSNVRLFPGGMSSRTAVRRGRALVYVEHGTSYHASLQLIHATGIDEEETRKITAATVKRSVRATGARFGPDETCREKIGGRRRSGIRMKTTSERDPYIIDVYGLVRK